MAFVKLDTKILNSTTWLDADACKVFITSLLMAEPFEVREPMATVNVRDTNAAEFVVPVGWYGFVPAAGPGIIHQALVEQEAGLAALERLASPDPGSRTPDHEGRRMVRVNGGYIILNYIAHRDKDHSAAERQARFRARKKMLDSNGVTVTPVTHADADADADAKAESKARAKATVQRAAAQASGFDAFWDLYPVKKGKQDAVKAWAKLKLHPDAVDALMFKLAQQVKHDDDWSRGYAPHPATYLNGHRWNDAIAQPKPAAGQQPGKTMEAIGQLERMRHGLEGQRVAGERGDHGVRVLAGPGDGAAAGV